MPSLYVVATEPFSGKTALCAALGSHFIDSGRTVGYFRPLSTPVGRSAGNTAAVDQDVEFLRRLWSLAEDDATLSPITLSSGLMEEVFRGDAASVQERLLDAHTRAASGKEVLLIEGPDNLMLGASAGLATDQVGDLLGAWTLVVARYAGDYVVDELLTSRRLFGDRLVGVVINAVPERKLEFVVEEAAPFLEARGVPVLAVLPEDRALLGVTVGEIADRLEAEIITADHARDRLVESLMVAAMTVDSGIEYFSRRENKAVIVGGNRPDLQLPALETSTACLVCTGNVPPNDTVVTLAQVNDIPILVAMDDTLTAVEHIEDLFGESRFFQPRKVERFRALLDERFAYDRLNRAIGIPVHA
ncbi:MAG TPA: phosphotransacetylase family protein [Dehalococcoidia bacterium]|nr:phosphotransacetylase family protein [Dehalococcoidia bacterium]